MMRAHVTTKADPQRRSAFGIHRTRLAASRVHRRLVKEARRIVEKLGWLVPNGEMQVRDLGIIQSSGGRSLREQIDLAVRQARQQERYRMKPQ